MNRRTFLTTSAAAILTACNKTPAGKIRLALDWKPEPEFGGFYAANYESHGLAADLLPGGSGTPTVQMIGAGSAEFGIVSADELVVARARGNDVVALFAVFQNCPQGIMVHPSRNMNTIADVFRGGTLAIDRGLPYARILEKKFSFDKVKIVPSPGGDISAFLHDPKFEQQCFVTSEPLAAMHAGVAVKVFPISDSGYNPYTTVLATHGNPQHHDYTIALAMVAAIREGWQQYLASPAATNAKMHALNPSMDLTTFAEVAEAQKPYIETANLGTMTAARWETLIAQLKDLGDIPPNPFAPTSALVFRTPTNTGHATTVASCTLQASAMRPQHGGVVLIHMLEHRSMSLATFDAPPLHKTPSASPASKPAPAQSPNRHAHPIHLPPNARPTRAHPSVPAPNAGTLSRKFPIFSRPCSSSISTSAIKSRFGTDIPEPRSPPVITTALKSQPSRAARNISTTGAPTPVASTAKAQSPANASLRTIVRTATLHHPSDKESPKAIFPHISPPTAQKHYPKKPGTDRSSPPPQQPNNPASAPNPAPNNT